MINQILNISKLNSDGFTFNLETKELYNPNEGFAVAYKETLHSEGIDGLQKAIKHALNNEKFVGGWFNYQTQKFNFDSVRIFEREKDAIEFAQENRQVSYFDFKNKKEVVTPKK